MFLGIDVGKSDFHCSLLEGDREARNSFPNSSAGFAKLAKWLKNRDVEHVHACMESTGGWSEALALFLVDVGHVVSVVNPLTVKAFGQSELSRTKTDRADASLIARYCRAMSPAPWKPPSANERKLQQLVRRRAGLDEMWIQEHNRLQAPLTEPVHGSIQKSISFLEGQIKDIDAQIDSLIDDDPTLRDRRRLLTTIPGIGDRVSSTLLGEIPRIEEFRNGKALAAFVGLCPHERRSGTSISSSSLSKVSNPAVRAVLYMPAISAIRWNPVLSKWALNLRARGKRPKQIIAAVMRRLLVLAYGVLKSGRAFDPAFALDGRHGI
jgi:transposase